MCERNYQNADTGRQLQTFRINKLKEKVYDWYSGYPGGRREETMGDFVKRKGYGEVFKMAVNGMIPNNKLRPVIMKQLTVTE